MASYLFHTIEAGDLGDLVLCWDARPLSWQEPDRSVGESSGYWSGTPRFLGASIALCDLEPKQAENALWHMVKSQPTSEAHRRAVQAWIAKRAEEEVERLPSPSESAADERADAA